MRRLFALFLFLFVLTPGLVLAESPARNDGSVDPAARASVSSYLAGFNAGIGGSWTSNEYKGMSSDGTFLPLIGYEGEHFYLRGVSGGLHLFKNSWFEFNVQLSYLSQHFYAGNSDSWAMRRLDDAPAAATGEDICGFLIEYVRQHYMEPLTLQELARRLNYSLPYVSKRFKDGTGVPFMEYLQNYRVTEGCRLLSGTNRTLEEITRMVGYQDVKFFSALVKRQTGLSPRGFRRRYQHEQSEQ